MELSIIIVNYKAKELTQKLARSFKQEKTWEVIVVDNEHENLGYGAGCNKGMERARGRFLLFLNPDVEIDRPSVCSMLSYLKEHPRVGIVGPQFIGRDDKVEQTCTDQPTPITAAVDLSFLNKLFPNNRFSKAYRISGWGRSTTRVVGAVAGAAMVVRAKDMRELDGFDPKFFLYWEEIDLCKRMKQLGKEVVFFSEAKARHLGQYSTKQSDRKLSEISEQSRKYFFRKHFGIFSSIALETWFFLTEEWRAVLLVLFAAVLRTAQLQTYVPFIGDMGREYLAAQQILDGQVVPLLGIPSSVPRFSQGPFNIWFAAASFLFGGRQLYAPVFLSAMLGVLAVSFLYLLLSKYFSKQTAFFSTLLFAASPLAVFHARMPFYLFAVPFFTIVYLWRLLTIQGDQKRSVFFAVLSFFLLFQWELATAPLGLLLLFAFVKKRVSFVKNLFPIMLGAGIGFLPQILYDLTHRCAQTCGFLIWAGYRVVAITGFDGKHGTSFGSLRETMQRFAEQLQKVIGWNESYSLSAIFGILGVGIWMAKKEKRLEKQPDLFWYGILGTIILTIGIFIHGSPSEAYLPPYLILLPILFAGVLEQAKKPIFRAFVMIFVFALVVKNTALLFHQHFFTTPVTEKLQAARWMVSRADARPIFIKSYDPGFEFATHLDHYIFLIKNAGGQTASSKTPESITYIISEQPEHTLPLGGYETRFGSVRVGVPQE